MTSAAAARDLDRALVRVLAGGEPEGEEHASALAAARRVRSLPQPAPEAPARSLARDLFLAEADARRARWVHAHHVPAVSPPPPKKAFRFSQVALLLMALMIAVTLGAALAVAASFSTPDSTLYPLKRSAENALLAVDRDPVTRSDLEVKLAQQRLREAETMAALGKPDLALNALQTRYDELRDAGDRLVAAPTRDARWKAARGRFIEESNQPIAALQRELTQRGYPSWAKQATDMAKGFQHYLDGLSGRLGSTALGSGDSSATQPSPPGPPPSVRP